MNGWIKLHRKINNNVFLSRDVYAFYVFVKLLTMANNKGQLGNSGRKLATEVNLKHSTLYKVLARLEKETMIKQSSKHGYTLITICNWAEYQEVSKHIGKQYVNKRETDGKRLTGVARIENKEEEIEPLKNEENPTAYIPEIRSNPETAFNPKATGYKTAQSIRDALKAPVPSDKLID
jgi:predicted transcriptional regulator